MKILNLKGSAIILLIMLAASCSEKNIDKASPVICVDIEDAEPFKNAITAMNVINLKDSLSEHFPGDISKLEWKGDSIFILDRFRDNGLYVYNQSGELIGSFVNRGNGPEEYLRLVDFCVTPQNVILLDSYAKANSICLDRQLAFVSKNEIENGTEHIAMVGEDVCWFDKGNNTSGEQNDKLVYCTGGRRTSVLTIPEEIEDFNFQSFNVFVPASGDTILYLPPTEPRIFKCSDAKAEIFCEFDFKGRWPDYANVDRANALGFIKKLGSEGMIHQTNLISSGDDIVYTFHAGEDFYILLFKYSDISQQRLLKLTKEEIEQSGYPVCLKNGALVFATPDRLVLAGI